MDSLSLSPTTIPPIMVAEASIATSSLSLSLSPKTIKKTNSQRRIFSLFFFVKKKKEWVFPLIAFRKKERKGRKEPLFPFCYLTNTIWKRIVWDRERGGLWKQRVRFYYVPKEKKKKRSSSQCESTQKSLYHQNYPLLIGTIMDFCSFFLFFLGAWCQGWVEMGTLLMGFGCYIFGSIVGVHSQPNLKLHVWAF